MSFKQDFLSITESLHQQKIEYAVCGAVALAIHGFVRATPGIDVIVAANSTEAASKVASSLGFQPSDEKRRPAIAIASMSHGRDAKSTSLHFLEITPALQPVWDSRTLYDVDDHRCWCVSRDGLIHMKQSTGRRSDEVDIERLIDPASHDPFLADAPAPTSMDAKAIGDRLELQSQLLEMCLILGTAKLVTR